MKFYMPFEKIEQHDDGTVTVSGIASSETKDSQGEIITSDAMKAAIPDYMSFGGTGALREMHQPIAAGVVLKAAVDETGRTHIEAKVVDANSVQKVLNRVFKGFSIGGKVTEKDGHVIKGLSLREISLVDRPANPDAIFSCFKADDGGEDEDGTSALKAAVTAALEKGDDIAPRVREALEALNKAFEPAGEDDGDEAEGKGKKKPADGDGDEPADKADAPADLQKADVEGIAKAALEPLQKALGDLGDDLRKAIAASEEAHKADIAKLAERLAKVEATPAQPKAIVRTITKGEENGGAPEPMTKAQIEAELAKMPPEERTRLMMKAALANPIQAA
jgi:hypothetical protein